MTPLGEASASAEAIGEHLLLLVEADPAAAHAAATEIVERSTRTGDRTLEVHARRALGVSLRALQRYDEAKAQLDLALALADDDVRLAGLVRISRAPCWMWLGDERAAADDLATAVAVLRGVDRAVAHFQQASFRQQFESAAATDRELDSAIRVLRRSDSPLHRLYEAHALTNRGLDRVYRGDVPARRGRPPAGSGSCTSGSTYGPPLPTRCTTSPSPPPRPATSSARSPT